MTYRQKCLQEKGRTCIFCGADSNVVAHHVDGDRQNNRLDNLIPVCRSCHGKIHAGAAGFESWYEKLSPAARRDYPDEAVRDRERIYMALADGLAGDLEDLYDEFDARSKLAGDGGIEKHDDFWMAAAELILDNREEVADRLGIPDVDE